MRVSCGLWVGLWGWVVRFPRYCGKRFFYPIPTTHYPTHYSLPIPTRNSASLLFREKGFTLIELIIVLIVLSAILVITFPRMEAFFAGGYLRSTSRRLVGNIRYLHDRSATTGKRYHLCYNLDENEYWIEEENEEGEFEELKTVLGKREALPEGITFLDIVTPEGKINSGQTLTLFFPKGYVTKSIIHLQNEKEEVQTLLLKGTMGQVMVYEGYVEEESE